MTYLEVQRMRKEAGGIGVFNGYVREGSNQLRAGVQAAFNRVGSPGGAPVYSRPTTPTPTPSYPRPRPATPQPAAQEKLPPGVARISDGKGGYLYTGTTTNGGTWTSRKLPNVNAVRPAYKPAAKPTSYLENPAAYARQHAARYGGKARRPVYPSNY